MTNFCDRSRSTLYRGQWPLMTPPSPVGRLLGVLLILFTLTGCATYSAPKTNPPLAADVKVFDPIPGSTGDKGRDALMYASLLVQERALRRSVVNSYCELADPC